MLHSWQQQELVFPSQWKYCVQTQEVSISSTCIPHDQTCLHCYPADSKRQVQVHKAHPALGHVGSDGFDGGLMKTPSCFVFTSFSWSSCLRPRRTRYSMRIISVLGILVFFLNSCWIWGRAPGLSLPARKNCLYRLRTCFWRLLCLIMVSHIAGSAFFHSMQLTIHARLFLTIPL